MQTILEKLSSRKLWLAIAGVATGIYIAIGGDASDISTVIGALTAVVPSVVYIITEGKIDADAVSAAVEIVQETTAVITEKE